MATKHPKKDKKDVVIKVTGKFVMHRLVDLFLPGVGVLLDAAHLQDIMEVYSAVGENMQEFKEVYDQFQQIKELYETGKDTAKVVELMQKMDIRKLRFSLDAEQAMEFIETAASAGCLAPDDILKLKDIITVQSALESSDIVPLMQRQKRAEELLQTYRGSHPGYFCDICRQKPLQGKRYHMPHSKFDACSACYEKMPLEKRVLLVRKHTRVACNGCFTTGFSGDCFSKVDGKADYCGRCFVSKDAEKKHNYVLI